MLIAALLFFVSLIRIQAQNTDAKSTVYHQKDYDVENPTADKDIKVLADYENALLVSGDSDVVRSFLADNFKSYGPGPSDSGTTDK